MGAGFPTMTIVMGQITDTFIEYQTILSVVEMPFPNKTDRYNFYNTNLSGIYNASEYYNIIENYYETKLNESEHIDPEMFILPSQLMARLDYSIEYLVQIYNDSVFNSGDVYVDNFRTDSTKWSMIMLGVAIGFVVCNFFILSTFAQAAKNQVYQIKLLFFRAVVHQDISWFDTKSSGDFATKITG